MVVASVRQQSSGCLVAQRPLDPLLALLPPATSAGVGSVSAEPDFLHVHAVGLCSGTLLRTAWTGGVGGVCGGVHGAQMAAQRSNCFRCDPEFPQRRQQQHGH